MSSESESDGDNSSSSDCELDPASHAAALKRLQSKDPEFYQFLKENDEKLLEYRDSDNAESEEEEVENDSETNENESEPENKNASHSDINLEEGDDNDISDRLQSLKDELQNSPNVQSCKKLMSLLKACVLKASNSEDQSLNIVDGSTFNEVIKLCLVELLPALRKTLKLQDGQSIDVSKSKLWKKVLTSVKSYLIDILKILSYLTESSSLKLLLKHVIGLVIFYKQFVKLARLLLKKMIVFWSTADEGIRVLALLIIVRVMKSLPSEYHPQILKQMYFAYVKNTKFTSTKTWPSINFMKRSLSEVYAINPEIAYEHAFIYMRQLGIHLRNAITTKKKETFQVVYNWQYVHCIMHWAHLICIIKDNDAVKSLIYPLVQTIIGTINLIPTLKYVPLRFHLIRVLIQISRETEAFIAIASLILDTLNLTDFNEKGTFTKKPVNLSCALKASKAQLSESGFKDGIITEVCSLFLEYFSLNSHKIGFPELALPTIVQLKQFLKKNKVAKYGQQLKAITDKLQENSNRISEQRKNVSFQITDYKAISHWESDLLQQGTPLNQSKPTVNEDSSSPPTKKQKISS